MYLGIDLGTSNSAIVGNDGRELRLYKTVDGADVLPSAIMIDRRGGMVAAIEEGFPQREIAEASYTFQQAVERREKSIVGVNDFVQEDEPPVPILYIDDTTADIQLTRLEQLRQSRDTDAVKRSLDALRTTARGQGNTMETLLECVRAYATVGEMCDALRDVWGEYEEVPLI